jgi:hypothetical protein
MIRHVEPGKWYFVVDCSRCLEAIPFAEAPAPEAEPKPSQAQVSNLKRLACGHVDSYAPTLVTRRQGPKSSNDA